METRFKGKNLDAMLGEVCWWSSKKQNLHEGCEYGEMVHEELLNVFGRILESSDEED